MIRIQNRPELNESEALVAARLHYGIDGTLTPLPGERDQNYLLEARDGRRLVFKVSSPEEPTPLLEFEAEMIAKLHADLDGLVPAILPAISGARLVHHEDSQGVAYRIRVVDFLPGRLLAGVRPRSLSLLRDLGVRMAELDSALGAYPDHPPHRVDFDWALGASGDVMQRGLELLEGEQHALVERALASFREHEPEFLGLGSQIIHGDVNDHNVLVEQDEDGALRVCGIIDLGDAHSAPRVFDLAIAIAYGVLDTRDPIAGAAAMTAGFYSVHPLLDQELAVIMPLVRARLGQSVCISAWRRREGVADTYHLVSEQPAWDLLRALDGVSDVLATAIVRDACGLEPHRGSESLQEWLAEQDVTPVMTMPSDDAQIGVLDLSVGSQECTGRDTDDTAEFTQRAFRRMERDGLAIGVGRFLEPRAFYLTDAFAGRPGDDRERRTIHLGIDLFDQAGAEVFAPLPGVVHSVQDNAGRLDYGPTVILEHAGPAGPFWTLFGHLERASVAELEVGAEVAAGDRIARLGPFPENGDWPPHLHFQIISDLLGYEGEFPGVALPRESGAWASISPDPNLILRLPCETTFVEPDGLAERRAAHMGSNLSLSYDDPIHVVRGRSTNLYDVLGREYLDCVNNVAHVGHEHPAVVDAGRRQMGLLNTNTRYLHEGIIQYAERLAALFPDPLSVCYFVNSGSEANELALRIARTVTGGSGVVALEGGYHGHSQSLIDVSHYKHAGTGGSGPPSWVRTASMPDPYRGEFRDAWDQHVKYARSVEDAFSELGRDGHRPAAFIAEAILSCGGQVVPPDGYFAAAYNRAREAGAVCIADEVQIGFGRVGSHWWGFEAAGVVPDIVTLGKPIGNGHPIGAVVTTPEIAAAFDNGMEFFSTFGGNPVSAAIGLAVLDVLDDEKLKDQALDVGGSLMNGLTDLKDRHPAIGDVRGAGLFLGIDFVSDRSTAAPSEAIASYVAREMKTRGVLLSTDGPHRNVIKIKPPMTFSHDDATRLVRELDDVLSHDYVRSAGPDEG